MPYPAGQGELKLTHAMAKLNNAGNKKPDFNLSGSNKRVVCKKFNRGHCQYGASCKFDHNRCVHCGKPGHLKTNCRKLKSEKVQGGEKSKVKLEK